MAPPKRKTGGRVTPKGTQPNDRAVVTSAAPGGDVAASSRFTPKAKKPLVPPSWIPVIMIVLLVGGGLMIMARYLVWSSSNIPTFIGLAMILGGLWTATKWQ